MKYKTLRDVPLRNYQRLQKIKEPNNFDIMSILFGYKTAKLNKTKQKEVDKLVLHLKKELEQENNLTNILEIDGVEYGFIPNLDDITYGENTDIVNYVSDWQTMHKAMAVMYRPIKQKIGNRYLIEEYVSSDKYSEIMKDAPLDVVLGCLVFFYNLTNELLNYIPNYLQKLAKKEEALLQGVSTTNGEDIQKYIALLKETSAGLKKSLNLDSILV